MADFAITKGNKPIATHNCHLITVRLPAKSKKAVFGRKSSPKLTLFRRRFFR